MVRMFLAAAAVMFGLAGSAPAVEYKWTGDGFVEITTPVPDPAPAPLNPPEPRRTQQVTIPPGFHAHTKTDGTVIVHSDKNVGKAGPHEGVASPWKKTGRPGDTVTVDTAIKVGDHVKSKVKPFVNGCVMQLSSYGPGGETLFAAVHSFYPEAVTWFSLSDLVPASAPTAATPSNGGSWQKICDYDANGKPIRCRMVWVPNPEPLSTYHIPASERFRPSNPEPLSLESGPGTLGTSPMTFHLHPTTTAAPVQYVAQLDDGDGGGSTRRFAPIRNFVERRQSRRGSWLTGRRSGGGCPTCP